MEAVLEPLECPLCDFQTDIEGSSNDGATSNKAPSHVERKTQLKKLATHLVLNHKLVIDKLDEITDLRSYMNHWRERFKGQSLNQYCTTIKTNTGPYDLHESEEYYLLSDDLPEDKELRNTLKEKNPRDEVLELIIREREDKSFSRTCMFCRKHFTGNRSLLFDHLTKDHHLRIGRPDNIINCDGLLDLIQSKVDGLICLYCEKTFKDWNSLKEHMRKKRHKRINPNNKEYDKFYICNYFPQSDDEDESDETDGSSTGEDEDEWSEWQECGEPIECLFCDFTTPDPKILFDDHLPKRHDFKFYDLVQGLDYYERVKIVNYLRWCYSQNKCYHCESDFANQQDLISHLSLENASRGHKVSELPSLDVWNSPNFYFSCKDNDPLLYHIRDGDE